jgi:uncharacterized protein (DUF4213/DUF364 family)
MQLIEKLYTCFEAKAREVTVDIVSVGLGYTAVATSDGGLGIAYSWIEEGHCCGGGGGGYEDFEGRPAVELLAWIRHPLRLRRSMALALINALNATRAAAMPEDRSGDRLFDALGIASGTHVAMVGHFAPMQARFDASGCQLMVLDAGKRIGERGEFYDRLGDWADVLVLTATSILNGSTEEILGRCRPAVRTVVLGPSTPMVPEVFAHLPVDLLAGSVPLDRDMVLRRIRHGCGTPMIQGHCRKVAHPVCRADEG